MTTIVKIERDPTSPCNKVIIQNESASVQILTCMTPDIEKHLLNKETIYAKVSFSAGKFKVLGLVKKQNW